VTLDWDGRAWFHCGARLRVAAGGGADFRVLEDCPAGVSAGLPPRELYERCLRCPAGRRARDARAGGRTA
jgi:hypothetical protein